MLKRLPLPVSGLILAAVLAVPGCERSPTPTEDRPAALARPLRILVVDDEPLGKAIGLEWKAASETDASVKHVTQQEVTGAARLAGDVVIFPTGMLGSLVESGLILPLDDEELNGEEFDRRDIFEQVRLRDLAWGNRTVAVPLGSPHLVLAYREDVFEKLALVPPKTWKEYAQICGQLADRSALRELAPAGESWQGAIEPLAPGWAGQMLLARAAAYATHRDQIACVFDYDTAEAMIDRPPYVRALEELVASQKDLPPERRIDARSAWRELLAGQAAMAITWPQRLPKNGAESAQSLRMGFALLPGSNETFNFATGKWEPREADESPHVTLLGIAGRLGAVTSTASNPAEAERFLIWLAGPEASMVVSPASRDTLPFRPSQLSSASRWTGVLGPESAKDFAQTFEASQSLPRSLALRLPGRDDYLQSLDAAVQKALTGEQSPTEALRAAAAEWNRITDSLGRDKQREANKRSLGLADLPEQM